MDYNKLIELRKIVSDNIIKELERDDFELNIRSYVSVHERLFKNILLGNGHLRKYNLEKPEEVLNEKSISYPDYHTVPSLLKFRFDEERNKDYSSKSKEEIIANVVKFAADIWYIHPFMEGNTRTTCIYIEKYLKALGFNISNDLFKEYAYYYRNALVRANFEDKKLHINKDYDPLIKIYLKALCDNTLELNDNDLYIPILFNSKKRVKNR